MSLMPEGLPRTFGDYTLLKQLGRGGMGQVFLARLKGRGLSGVDKVCVVKTLRASNEPEYERRFIDEARLIVLLSHKNICPVFDAGCFEGQYYLALEHIAGREVRHLQVSCEARGQPVAEAVAIHIVKETLEALDAAHRMVHPLTKEPLRVVHRDVSPQNVMISEEGEVKLIDFGLAVSSQKLERTAPSIVMGKMAYMAPEQARGEAVDARTDQFAAGVMLYELLANERYYGSLSVDAIWRASGYGEHLPEGLARIAPDVQAIIKRSTASTRDGRFASCGDMRDALTAVELKRGVIASSRELRAALMLVDTGSSGAVSVATPKAPEPSVPSTAMPPPDIEASTLMPLPHHEPSTESGPAPERTRTFRLITEEHGGQTTEVGVVEGLEPGSLVSGDVFRTVSTTTPALPAVRHDDETTRRPISRPTAAIAHERTMLVRPGAATVPPASPPSQSRRGPLAAVAGFVVVVGIAMGIAVAFRADVGAPAIPPPTTIGVTPLTPPPPTVAPSIVSADADAGVHVVVVDAGGIAAEVVDAGSADGDADIDGADAGTPRQKRPRVRRTRDLPSLPKTVFEAATFLQTRCGDLACANAFQGEKLKEELTKLEALLADCYRRCQASPRP